jgi:hypothetical protein
MSSSAMKFATKAFRRSAQNSRSALPTAMARSAGLFFRKVRVQHYVPQVLT